MELTICKDGPVVLFDANGNTGVLVSVTDYGSGVALSDASGKHRLILNIDRSGVPGVVMRDSDGRSRIVVSAQKDAQQA